jgi:hypothetical protein
MICLNRRTNHMNWNTIRADQRTIHMQCRASHMRRRVIHMSRTRLFPRGERNRVGKGPKWTSSQVRSHVADTKWFGAVQKWSKGDRIHDKSFKICAGVGALASCLSRQNYTEEKVTPSPSATRKAKTAKARVLGPPPGVVSPCI